MFKSFIKFAPFAMLPKLERNFFKILSESISNLSMSNHLSFSAGQTTSGFDDDSFVFFTLLTFSFLDFPFFSVFFYLIFNSFISLPPTCTSFSSWSFLPISLRETNGLLTINLKWAKREMTRLNQTLTQSMTFKKIKGREM